MVNADIFSITDLRKNPVSVMQRANSRPVFIFKNNRMMNVIISADEYERLYSNQLDIYTKEDEKAYQDFLEEHQKGETIDFDDLRKELDV